MASVFRAYDRQLGRFVAVKLFPPGTAADDARRRGEAQALARLTHPHLVALYDAHLSGDGEETPSFLVMELVDGEDLRSRLDAGPLPAVEAAAVATDVAEALVVVHGAGMIHRDLKPANILLADPRIPGRPPIVKLADFGIAHLLGAERLTTAGTVIGTAGYLSPEQLHGGDAGPASDIYALGLVVLEALTGRAQYPGTALEAVAGRADHDPRVPADLPDGWRGLLLAMTAREPELRPSAAEVATMAAEMAPELAGWRPYTDGGAAVAGISAGEAVDSPAGAAAEIAETGAEGAPTVALAAVGAGAGAAAAGAAAAGLTAPGTTAAGSTAAGSTAAGSAAAGSTATGSTAPTVRLRPRERRRRPWLTAGIGVASAAAVTVALSLGAILSTSAGEADTGQTNRPTPSVTAPPATVEPAVVPEPAPSDDGWAPATDDTTVDTGNSGKGNGNEKGNGPGKNSGDGKGDKGPGNGKGKSGKG